MKQFFYLPVFCALILAACTEPFKKVKTGLEYKIISDGKGKAIVYGNFMQIHLKAQYKDGKKDTVLTNTRDFMPIIQLFDSVSNPKEFYTILKQLRVGDSLVLKSLVDSTFASSPQGLPPFMKKGGYLYRYVKVINIFENKDQADSAYQAEMALSKPKIYKKQKESIEKDLALNKAQLDTDAKKIEEYLKKNNITATKTSWGTYIAIHEEGTGEKINNSNVAVVNYTGKTLDSAIVFDSNIDPKFGHAQPYEVYVSQLGSVIFGWSDALVQLKKGSKATIYIPSSLAYGKTGNGKIKPNENLIFDIEVINVVTEEEQMAKMKQMEETTRRLADSMHNSKKNTPNKK